MTDPALRVAVLAAIVAAALVVIWLARRRARNVGPPVDVRELASGPAAVVFTKDDCPTCDETLQRLRALNVRIVQVRAEDRPDEFEARGITAVPVTVVLDESGESRGQFRGLPPSASLRRAVHRAR